MAENMKCAFCGQEIVNEDDIYNFRNSNGKLDHWHKECAINQGYDITKPMYEYSNYSSSVSSSNIPVTFLFIIMLGFMIFIFSTFAKACSHTEPVNEPKRFEDMTNRELQDFLEWDAKQKQKQWENEKAFK